MRNAQPRGERGSIPIVLLATITVTGLVVVLVASTITGQRQARFDQGFEQALQISEVGIERLLYLVRSGQLEDTPGAEFDDEPVGGGLYSASATSDGTSWILTSTGVAADGTERTVSVNVRPVPFFNVGFFAEESFQAGGTTTLGMDDHADLQAALDAIGGSNDRVHFNGHPSMPVGAVVLTDWEDNPDHSRCSFSGSGELDCTDSTFFTHQADRYEIVNDSRNRFIQDIAENCTTLTTNQLTSLTPGDYCASTNITFGNPFVVNGSGEVRILVSGNGRIQIADAAGGHENRRVNWTGLAHQLQVYAPNASQVEIRSNTFAKGLFYAPNAFCYGRGGVTYHGALMCRSIDTGGNSTYWVPEDIINVTTDTFFTTGWRESGP